MIVSIHQPNYIPWLGYFNKMARSDVFVLFDDVQLVRGKSYTVRSEIKTANGVLWLTVPVKEKGSLVLIKDASIVPNGKWQKKHWNSILLSYKKAPYFSEYQSKFEPFYTEKHWDNLCELNISFIKLIKDLIGIDTKLILSSKLNIEEGGGDKIISILKKLKCDKYITGEGKGSRRYVDDQVFSANNIALVTQGFTHPVYPQLWGDFAPNLSILDLLFNCGPDSLGILSHQRDHNQ